MSKETVQWLNENTMIGHVSNKEKWATNGWMIESGGVFKAWWQQPNYRFAYPGAIPINDVVEYLFNWEPVEASIHLRKPCTEADADGMDGDGNYFRWVPDMVSKAIVHPNTNHVFGYFGADSYKVHDRKKWMIDDVGRAVDGELGVDSAGQLRHGGVSYVTLSLPDDVETTSGFSFRPTIVASTSCDGSRATTYSVVNMIPVCDNSLAQAEKTAKNVYRVKHTAKSEFNIGTARDALGIIYKNAAEFVEFIDALTKVEVTDQQFYGIVSGLVPIPQLIRKGTKVANQRAITIATDKQAELIGLYERDRRAAPWKGTMLGAVQAVNTWNEHFRSRNDNQVERVMTGVLTGSFDKMDGEFWTIVDRYNNTDGVKAIDLRPLAAVGK